jgi:monoamine oxidase
MLPFPHNPHYVQQAREAEALSAEQRLSVIAPILDQRTTVILKGAIAAICGSIDFEEIGFFDILRWWALCGYSTAGLFDCTEGFKVKEGQTAFAQKFFDEANATGRLSYAFNRPVARITNSASNVVVTTRNGMELHAARAICTLPLNVLGDISFEPQLPLRKMRALRRKQIHQGAKVHLEVKGRQLRSWSAISFPSPRILSCLGDGITPAGNTHLVGFATNEPSLSPEQDAQSITSSAEQLHPDLALERLVWHNWAADEFAKGGWCMFGPDYSFNHLDALRESVGKLWFANADWPLGWRGFIDGAIEEGTRAAKEVAAASQEYVDLLPSSL